jgi:hypothetical protein
MSYRLRLGSFPKEEHIKYKDKFYEEIINEFSQGNPDDFIFASPKEFNQIEYIPPFNYKDKDSWKDFYSFNIVKEVDNEFFILNKENLKTIIDKLSEEIFKMYNEIYEDFESPNSQSRLASMVMGKKNDWDTKFFTTLILDEDKICLTESGSYEYLVFNLVAIYKMFNWDKDYLILSGW